MRVIAHKIDILTGGNNVVAVGPKVAQDLDLNPMDRVRLTVPDPKNGEDAPHVEDDKTRVSCVATVDFWTESRPGYEVALFEDTFLTLGIEDGQEISLMPLGKPPSIEYIKKKMAGEELTEHELNAIIADVVDDRLTEVEVASFISAVSMSDMTLNEITCLTRALVSTGETMSFPQDVVADKHCSGGVPGNRTTLIVVPIMAALGVCMPKSSSRAISSAAGTADAMEVLADVTLSKEKVFEAVEKANGCIAWGGGLNLAPADDKLIRVRKPMGLDPIGLFLPSILAKKYSMGSTHVLFDLPLGYEAKISSIGEVKHLESIIIKLGRMLGMKIDVLISYGDEPIGNGIGPVLEVQDVLKVLQNKPDAPKDLEEKSLLIAGRLIELIGIERFKEGGRRGDGVKVAEEVLRSGKAWKQMQKIIKAQGGNPKISLKDLKLAPYTYDIVAERSGKMLDTINTVVAKVARMAGSPQNKSAGVYLNRKFNEFVNRGDVLATVYAGSEDKLRRVKRLLDETPMFEVM